MRSVIQLSLHVFSGRSFFSYFYSPNMVLITRVWFTHTHIQLPQGHFACPLARSSSLVVNRRFRPYSTHNCATHQTPYITACYVQTHRLRYHDDQVSVPHVIVYPPPPCPLLVRHPHPAPPQAPAPAPAPPPAPAPGGPA